MAKEIEAKFLQIDKDALRAKLHALGFQLINPEYLMRRKTFDCGLIFPGKNKWGRVRQEAGRVTMTLKEITGDGINDTHEIEAPAETEVRAVSEELGFDFSQALFGSIDLVYEREIGIPAHQLTKMPEVTFASPPKAAT